MARTRSNSERQIQRTQGVSKESKRQLMDAGVIQTIKLRYKRHSRRTVQHLSARIDQATPASELAQQVNILDATKQLTASRSKVQPMSIQKRFSHRLFAKEAEPSEFHEPEIDQHPAAESVNTFESRHRQIMQPWAKSLKQTTHCPMIGSIEPS
eukprot:scpid84856/ scgid16017/ 